MTLRRSAFDHRTAMRLAATEYGRCLRQWRGLRSDDWTTPTECPGWTVRDMVAHLVGMAEMAASIREGRRQVKTAQAQGGVFIDALTGLQVAERADWSPEQLVDRYARRISAAVRGRWMTPPFVRSRSMGLAQNVGGVAGGRRRDHDRWKTSWSRQMHIVVVTTDAHSRSHDRCTSSWSRQMHIVVVTTDAHSRSRTACR
jgi:hypothetical protein